jgi:hypothetical protein
MPTLRRGYRRRSDKQKPEIVTGSFELHYEDVVNQNRFAIVLVFTSVLIAVAAFIPRVIDTSVADTDKVSIEAEKGDVINQNLVEFISGDVTASENSYIEFR